MTSDDAQPGGGSAAPTLVIDPAKWYTLGQAAKLTAFTRDVLAARCDSGHLPCVRAVGTTTGRGWRKVLGADLLEFMRRAGAKVPAAPPPKGTAKGPRRDTRSKLSAAFAELERMGLA
jgi:hypothetical protein